LNTITISNSVSVVTFNTITVFNSVSVVTLNSVCYSVSVSVSVNSYGICSFCFSVHRWWDGRFFLLAVAYNFAYSISKCFRSLDFCPHGPLVAVASPCPIASSASPCASLAYTCPPILDVFAFSKVRSVNGFVDLHIETDASLSKFLCLWRTSLI
jgi:hypothetical protein